MKILASLLAAIAIALTIGIAIFGPGQAFAGQMMQTKTGDLNADGATNSVDALLVLFYDAGMSKRPVDADVWFAGADVNCDTVVNAIDATLILQAGAGLYDLRP